MFMTRLFSSILLVIAALVTLLQGGYLLAAVLLLISLLACFELYKACGIHEGDKKINALEVVGGIGIVVYYAVLVWSDAPNGPMLTLIFTLAAFMAVYVFTFPGFHAAQVMAAFFCFVYAPVMLGFIYMTRELSYGIYIVWMIFISSWICDSCAYLAGILLGKHKLAPKLSPKKSIEGAVGGVVGSALVGGLYGYLVVERAVPGQRVTLIFVVISAVGAVISQIGDLAASAIKRNHEIKDYGHLIPGHGGIMDRFDSVIFTAPMIYALAVLLIKQM